MAIKKNIECGSGCVGEYIRVVGMQFGNFIDVGNSQRSPYIGKRMDIVYHVYVNELARRGGKVPMEIKTIILEPNNGEAIDTTDPIKSAYTILKTQPEFKDSIDC